MSTTLHSVDWQNSTLIEGDVVEAIRKLKEAPGGDINVSASSTLVRWLLDEGLLDELHLLVHRWSPVPASACSNLTAGQQHCGS